MSSCPFFCTGNFKKFENQTDVIQAKACFLARHPEAEDWPTSHEYDFYTMDIEYIYWVGGFGGTHYIGFLDPDMYLKQTL